MPDPRRLKRTPNPVIDAGPLLAYIDRVLKDAGMGRDNLPLFNDPTGRRRLTRHEGSIESFIGRSYRTLDRIRHNGYIRFYEADQICTQLGVHMSQVYGYANYLSLFDEYDDELLEAAAG